MPITLKDVAKAAGVSAQAVSLVLNGRGKGEISENTVKRILAAVESTGYRRNLSARRVRCSCSETITLVIDDYINSSLDFRDFRHSGIAFDAIKGVIDGGFEKGYDVKLLSLSHSDPEILEKLKKRVGEPYSDGVIFLGMFYQQELYNLVENAKIPHITIKLHNSKRHFEVTPAVSVEPFNAMRQMVRHLLDSGYKKIAYSTHQPVDLDYLPQRFAGFEAELKAAGLFAPERIFICRNANAIREMAAKPDLKKHCDAIVSMNDMMANIWRNELEYNGYKIPGDFMVAGYDALFEDILSVDTLRYECGVRAVTELINSIRKKRLVDNIVVPSVLRLPII